MTLRLGHLLVAALACAAPAWAQDPAWQASSAIAASTGADVTVTLPAHAANDVLLLQVVVRDVDDTITWPAGWAQLATVDRGTTSRYWWAWKRAASASETNPLVDKSTATGDTYAAVTTYRNAITTGDPWEAVGTPNTATTAAHVLNGVTTLSPRSLVVASLCGEDNTAASGTTFGATDPTSLTQVLYVESVTGADGACTAGAAVRTAAGATGSVTATWTATVVGSGGIVLALKGLPKDLTAVTVTQASSADLEDGTAGNEILKAQFTVTGVSTTMNLQSVTVTAQNSDTSNNDVTSVRIFYNTTDNFATATDITIGGPYTFPAGATATVAVDVTDTDLPGGSSYIWIVYDIALIPTSTENNTVDAVLATGNISTQDAQSWPSSDQNPAGSRTIKDDLTIYVNFTSGNDTTGDGTSGNPYLTLTKALGDVPTTAFTRAWNIVVQDSGTSNETATITGKGATAAYRLTIRAASGQTPILDNGNSSFLFDIDDDYITIDGFTCRNSTSFAAISLDGDNTGELDNEVLNCVVYNSLWGIYCRAENSTIRNTVVHTIVRSGILIYAADGCTVENCSVYSCGDGSSSIAYSCLRIYLTTNSGTYKNNILSNDKGAAFETFGFDQGQTFTSDFNDYFGSSGTRLGYEYGGSGALTSVAAIAAETGDDASSISADPQFVDPANATVASRDFHLLSRYGHKKNDGLWYRSSSTNSPAIDSADSGATFTNELEDNGNRRNLGAYGNTSSASKSGPGNAPSVGAHTPLSDNYWTGDVNGNWNSHGNWAHGKPGATAADPPTSAANDEWGRVRYDPDDVGATLNPNPATTNLTLDTAAGYAYSLTMPAAITGTLAVGANTLNVGAGGFDGVDGTLTVGSGTIKCAGAWDDSDGVGGQGVTFTPTSGTVEFNPSSGTPSIAQGSGNRFFNFTVNTGGGTPTAAGALDINGAVSIPAGTWNPGSYTHTVAGNWSESGSGVWQPTAGTIQFDGTTSITQLSTNYFNHVTLAGSVTLSSGGYVRGNFTKNAATTFTHGSQTLTFSGGATQTLTLTSAATFFGFTVNKSAGTLSLAGGTALDIDGAFNVTAGTFDAGNGVTTHDVAGTMTINGGRLRVDAGTIAFSAAGHTLSSGFLDMSGGGRLNLNSAAASVDLTISGGTLLCVGTGGNPVLATASGTDNLVIRATGGAIDVNGLTLQDLGTAAGIEGFQIDSGATFNNFNDLTLSSYTYGVFFNRTAAETLTIRAPVFNSNKPSANYNLKVAAGSMAVSAENATGVGGQEDSTGGNNIGGEENDSDPGDTDSTSDTSQGQITWLYFDWKWIGNNNSNWDNGTTSNWEFQGSVPVVAPYHPNATTHRVWIQGGVPCNQNGSFSVQDITVSAGATLNQDGGGARNLSIYGTAFKSAGGTFTHSGSDDTVTFAGSASQTVVIIGGSGTFWNLTIDKTSGTTATLGTSLEVDGTTTVSGGTFELAQYTLTQDGALTVASTNGATLSATGIGEIVRNGSPSTAMTVSGTLTMASSSSIDWSAGTGVVTLSGTGSLSGTSSITLGAGVNSVSGSLTLTGGMTVYVPDAGTLNIASGGSLTTGGTTPTITRKTGGSGGFAFNAQSGSSLTINGLNFSYAGTSGLNIATGISLIQIDGIAFTNATSGGRHMTVAGSYTITAFSCSFDSTFGGGSNVNAAGMTGGTITFSNYSGAGAGESYDNDPAEPAAHRIGWATTRTWVGKWVYWRQVQGLGAATGNQYVFLRIDSSTSPTVAELEADATTAGLTLTADMLRVAWNDTSSGEWAELARTIGEFDLAADRIWVHFKLPAAFSGAGGDTVRLYYAASAPGGAPALSDSESPKTLFSDDFERPTGTTLGNGWTENTDDDSGISNASAFTGASGAEVGMEDQVTTPWMEQDISTSAYYGIKWVYSRSTTANVFAASDNFYVEYEIDTSGPAGSNVETLSNSVAWATITVTFLPASSAENNANFAIRYRISRNGVGEDLWVDDISVKAYKGDVAVVSGTVLGARSNATNGAPGTRGLWSDPFNWTDGASPRNCGKPTASTDAVIDGNGTYAPILDEAGTCLSLKMGQTNASDLELSTFNLTIGGPFTSYAAGPGNVTDTSGASTMFVAGDWTNNGSFSPNPNITVEFNGSRDQAIAGSTASFHHLTVNNSGAAATDDVTAGVALALSGNFALNDGEFAPGGFTHTVAGNWTETAGTFAPTAGTIEFNGTGTQNLTHLGANNFWNVTMTAAGARVALSALDIDGAFTVSGGSFDNGAFTHTVAGNFLKDGGSLIMDSASDDLDIEGNFTVTGGTAGTLTAGDIFVAGNVNVSGASSFIVTSTSHTLRMDGGTNRTVTVTGASNTLGRFYVSKSSATVEVDTAGAVTALDVEVDGGIFEILGHTVTSTTAGVIGFQVWAQPTVAVGGELKMITAGGLLDVAGDFKVGNGADTANTAKATISDGTIEVGNDFIVTSPQTFAPTGGTVDFAGNASVIHDVEFYAGDNFHHLTFNPGSAATWRPSNNMTDGLTIAVNGNLTINGRTGGTAGTFTAVEAAGNNHPFDVAGNVAIVTNTVESSLVPGTASHTVAGNWDDTGGSFVATAGKVTFDGAAAQSITSEATNSFFNVDVSNSAGAANVSLTGTVDIDGALNVIDGVLAVGTSTTSVAGAAAVAGAGSPELLLAGAGTLKLGTSLTVGNGTDAGKFSMTAAATVTTTGVAGTNFYAVTVTSSGTLNLTNGSFISLDTNGLTINDGATVNNGTANRMDGVTFSSIQTGGTCVRFLHPGNAGPLVTFNVRGMTWDTTSGFNVSTVGTANPAFLRINASGSGTRFGPTYENDHAAGEDETATSTVRWGYRITVYNSPTDLTAVAGMAIRFILNGADQGAQLTDASGRVFNFDMAAGDVMLFYRDVGAVSETYVGTERVAGVTVPAGATGLMSLYKNYLVVNHQNGGALTNANLATADGGPFGGDSPDIPYVVTGANVEIGNATATTMHLRIDGSYTPGGSIAWNASASGNLEQSAGTFTLGAGETITMKDTRSINVTGGTFRLAGTSGSTATITVPTPGTHRFGMDLASGATLDADWYTFNSPNTNGLVVHSGAAIAGIDNGTFSNVASGGAYINLAPASSPPTSADRDNIPVSFNNLTFNGTGGSNVKAGLGTPTVLVTGGGALFGETYDDDRGEAAGSGGRIHFDAAPIRRVSDAAAFASIERALADAGTGDGSRLNVLTRWPINLEALNLDAAGDNVIVENGVFWPRTGLAVDNASERGTFRNCSVVRGGVDFTRLENCVVFQPGAGTPATTNTTAYNTVFEDTPTLTGGTNNLTGQGGAIFQNAAQMDFHLLSTAAAAINTGTPLTLAEDFEGQGRPIGAAWDIGVDERVTDSAGAIAPTPDAESPTLGDITQYWSVFRGTSRFMYVTTRASGGAYDNMLVLLNRATLAVAATFQSPYPIHGMTYAAIDSSGADTEYRLFLLVDTDADDYADGILALIDTYTSLSGGAFTTADFVNPAVDQTDANAADWYVADKIYVDRSFDRAPIGDGDGVLTFGGGARVGHLMYRSIDGEGDGTEPAVTHDKRRWSKRIFVVKDNLLYKVNADPLDYSDGGGGTNREYGRTVYSTVGNAPYQWRVPPTYLVGSSKLYTPVHSDGAANWLAAMVPWGGNAAPADDAGWSIDASNNENLYGHSIKLNGGAANQNTFIHVGSSESNRVVAFRANMAASGNFWITAAGGGESLETPITSAPIRPLPVTTDYVFVGADDRIEKIKDDSDLAASTPPNGEKAWGGASGDTDGDQTNGYGRISSNLDYITDGSVTRLFWGTERGFVGSMQVKLTGPEASSDESFDAGFPYVLAGDEVTSVLISFEPTGWSVVFVTRSGRLLKFYTQ